MFNRFTKALCLLLCVLFAFTGCKQTNAIIRFDIARGTKNLDPQYATDQTAQLVIYNTFEGLLRSMPNGEIVPAAAEGYSLSPDERVYTFTLRENMHWKSGDKVRAQDFEFAIKRMFSPITKSPFVESYSGIKNARRIIDGELEVDALGVVSVDERTLVITLEQPNALFVQQLTHTSAMPCNRQSFDETGGRYGLRLDTIDCNGPFYVKYWDNQSYIGLRKNGKYRDERSVKTGGVNFYINREKDDVPLFELLMEDNADSVQGTYAQARLAAQRGLTADTTVNTTWCLLFNMGEGSEFREWDLRQAFAQAIDKGYMQTVHTPEFTAATRMVPPSVTLLGAVYNDVVEVPPYYAYAPDIARTAYKQGLADLDISRIENVRFLVPDMGDAPAQAVYLQQMWQKELGSFVTMSVLPQDELTEKLQAGDFDIAFVPIKSNFSRPGDVLENFVTDAPNNYMGYSSPEYDGYIATAEASTGQSDIITGYKYGEMALCRDLPVYPLWYQTAYNINGKDVSGIVYYPEPERTYFKYAVRMK